MVRNLVCWFLIALFPLSLMAADTGAAMLYSKGETWVNGTAVPNSSAIFPGDQVQSSAASAVNIHASGSNVLIAPDSLVKFDAAAIGLEHGGVRVTTSKGMMTRVGDVTVAPTTNAWTEFEVSDLNGSVQVIARKGDVSVSDPQGTSTVPEGQQTTRDESQPTNQKSSKKRPGAATAGQGGILDSPVAIYLGAGAIGGGVIWILLQGDEPLSPKAP